MPSGQSRSKILHATVDRTLRRLRRRVSASYTHARFAYYGTDTGLGKGASYARTQEQSLMD